jgi:Zn-dependent protease
MAGLKLGKIAGIRVYIHWSFALLILYIIFSNYRQGNNAVQTMWSVLFVLSIFLTVVLHELGHALAARRYKIATKDITLLPIGGLARLESMPEKPSEELVVAIAGPAVNVVIALITWLAISIPDATEFTELMQGGVNASNFFMNFLIVNIWLAVFNLIPAFPMDGGRVLRALLSMRFERHVATNIAARIGQVLAIGFIIAGFYINPFLIIIGIFIFFGAQAEAQFTQSKSMLGDYKVKDAVMKDFQTIETIEPVKTAVHLLLNGQNKTFLITKNQIPAGTLSRDEIIRALAESGDNTPVGTIMNPNLIILESEMLLEKVYQQMLQHKSPLMLVVENNKPIGTLDPENILEFIMIADAKRKHIRS